MIETNDNNFKEDVLDSKGITIAYFGASWCGPCKALHKILDELSADVRIFKIDVDDNPRLSETYSIMGVPTVMLFKDGELKSTTVGLNNKKFYTDLIEEAK